MIMMILISFLLFPIPGTVSGYWWLLLWTIIDPLLWCYWFLDRLIILDPDIAYFLCHSYFLVLSPFMSALVSTCNLFCACWCCSFFTLLLVNTPQVFIAIFCLILIIDLCIFLLSFITNVIFLRFLLFSMPIIYMFHWNIPIIFTVSCLSLISGADNYKIHFPLQLIDTGVGHFCCNLCRCLLFLFFWHLFSLFTISHFVLYLLLFTDSILWPCMCNFYSVFLSAVSLK